MTAATATQTADLAAIVANLDAHIAGIDSTIAQAQAKLVQHELDLQSWAANKNKCAGDLATAQQQVSQIQGELSIARNDLALSKGTSLQGMKKSELERLQHEWEVASKELESWQVGYEHDSQAESETAASLATIGQQLAALAAERADLQATRYRFDQEQCQHIRDIGLAELQKADDRIDELEGMLRDAKAQRYVTVVELATNLAPWKGDQSIIDCIAQAGHFEDDSPAIMAVQTQLAEAEASLEASRRQRAQSGMVELDTTIVSAQMQITYLAQRIEALRLQARQHAAQALLAQVKQTPH
jgi:hypothetical protein